MHRLICGYLLSIALVLPVTTRAEEHHFKRYYDRDARDWHEWNEREERAYHRYWEERHDRHREWARLRREQQREYWRWRHQHPDTVLFR
jgi:hypothetical protein